MGSSLPIASLVLIACLALMHCTQLEAADGKDAPAPASSSPDGTSSSPKGSKGVALKNGTAKARTKPMMGKGYGPGRYEHSGEGYGHHQPQGYGSYEQGGYGGGYGREEGYGRGYGHQDSYEHGDQYKHHNNNNGYGHGYNKRHEYGPFHFEHGHGYGHSYDTHYCSVHGSFSLALSHNDYDNSYEKKDNGYGTDSYDKKDNYGGDEGYGKKDNDGYGVDSYGPKKHNYKPRFHTRQYCRYAAAASDRSCQFCCRVVARSSNTSPDDIVAAIFNFNPFEPTANGAGFGHHQKYDQDKKGGGDYGKDSYGKKGYEADSSAFQCVCCAPKHDSSSSYKKK